MSIRKLLEDNAHKVADEDWLNKLVDAVGLHIREMDGVQGPLGDPAIKESLAVIENHKEVIEKAGNHAFTLAMYQLSLGESRNATNSLIQSISDPVELIALMNATSDGVIKAKQELDKLNSEVGAFILDILKVGAKHLLPFLLAAI